MREPWERPAEQRSNPGVSYTSAGDQPVERASNAVSVPTKAPVAQSADDEIATDSLPDPIREGQRFAQAGGRPPTRRSGRLPETPLESLRSANFTSHLRALKEIEPNNPQLTRISPPDWRPTEEDIAKIHQELLMARQRSAGAIDGQASGIGIGPFARESILARSSKRDFTDAERAEINRIGGRYGCHTCGTKDPGTTSGTFILDHQRATRLNEPEAPQRIFPQCYGCSSRQGGLIAGAIKREKP